MVGYYISVEGYLQALTQRVREFDRTGRLPVYMILVDLNYWEGNRGRLYTDVLQDPLGARTRLPRQEDPENRKLQEGIDRAQQELREAVAGSKRLQEEAARRGQGWLRKYVAVHLDVMNPADVSYRTSRLIGYLPIAPDNMVRDHRKIAFFDLTELDPAKGEALFGGVGVGEQYATATWEDRAVRLRGPAALTLKDAARRYLKANGFTDANIPPPLQPLPKPADYDERVKALEARGWTATAMQVHNDRGFAEKDASIASAVLYTLMPPNSLIVVPDSIWTHELWAAYLTGAALRGCHVYVIAPSAAERAVGGLSPALPHARDLQPLPRDPDSSSGRRSRPAAGGCAPGSTPGGPASTTSRRSSPRCARPSSATPSSRRTSPSPRSSTPAWARPRRQLAAQGYKPAEELPEDARARLPKMHRKTQLFATRDALAASCATRAPRR